MTVNLPAYAEAKALLIEIVEAKGKGRDYVYPGADIYRECLYFERDEDGTLTPSCGVGHVIDRVRGDEPPSSDWEGRRFEQLVDHVWTDEPLQCDDTRTLILLSMFQMQQDQGVPWGVALDRAIAHAEATR